MKMLINENTMYLDPTLFTWMLDHLSKHNQTIKPGRSNLPLIHKPLIYKSIK